LSSETKAKTFPGKAHNDLCKILNEYTNINVNIYTCGAQNTKEVNNTQTRLSRFKGFK